MASRDGVRPHTLPPSPPSPSHCPLRSGPGSGQAGFRSGGGRCRHGAGGAEAPSGARTPLGDPSPPPPCSPLEQSISWGGARHAPPPQGGSPPWPEVKIVSLQ